MSWEVDRRPSSQKPRFLRDRWRVPEAAWRELREPSRNRAGRDAPVGPTMGAVGGRPTGVDAGRWAQPPLSGKSTLLFGRAGGMDYDTPQTDILAEDRSELIAFHLNLHFVSFFILSFMML